MFKLDSLPEFCIGFVTGGIVAVLLVFPHIGRAIGKAVAVGLMALGGGLLTWGVIATFQATAFEPLAIAGLVFYNTAQILGWGAGCLVGGITALVLAFVAPPKRLKQ